MAGSPSRREFSEIVSRPDAEVSLAEASLLIARQEYPELDVRAYLEKLDGMAMVLRDRVGGADPRALVEALRLYLFDEQGFHGNADDYYDPRNSFLNDVIDRRIGIPITLSAVYMEVGRRLGLAVEGVGLPGHFIVRVGPPSDSLGSTGGGPGSGRRASLLVDPFHGGVPLTEDDCQERLDRIYGGRVRLAGPLLTPCSAKSMLARMLRNLKGIYLKQQDQERALRIVELLLEVHPHSVEDLRDRGLLYAALDCYTLAVKDLERYLALCPGAPEALQLRAKMETVRFKASRVN